jgi:hypothetical protein
MATVHLKDSNKIVQSFWTGKITNMERLCMQSYIDNGHEFHLYTYEPQDAALFAPAGVRIFDANDIVPKPRSADFDNPQQFADYFRYLLLYEKGGWWMDMDAICLRKFDFDAEYVFALAPSGGFYIYNGFIKVPPKSDVMRYCVERTLPLTQQRLSGLSFQDLGPSLITDAIRQYDLSRYVLPGDTFDPVHWYRAEQIVDPNVAWDLSQSYTVHLFHAMWNNGHEAFNYKISPDTDGVFPPECLYEQLKRRYTHPPKVSIVITTFNRPHLLKETLASFAAQAYKDYEVIIVDDGTDTETEGICREAKVEYIKLRNTTHYRCPSYPNNVGIRRAKGEVIILQNAECKHVDPRTIEKLASLTHDDNAVFARVMGQTQNGTDDWLYCGAEAPRPFFFCGALKRSWFEKLRGMDEDYPAGGYDDNDFADRLAKEGVRFDYSPVLVHHLWHERPTIPVDAALTCYQTKTAEMAAGRLGTVRNPKGWGEKEHEPLVVNPVDFVAKGWHKATFVPTHNKPRYAPDGLTMDWWDTHKLSGVSAPITDAPYDSALNKTPL